MNTYILFVFHYLGQDNCFGTASIIGVYRVRMCETYYEMLPELLRLSMSCKLSHSRKWWISSRVKTYDLISTEEPVPTVANTYISLTEEQSTNGSLVTTIPLYEWTSSAVVYHYRHIQQWMYWTESINMFSRGDQTIVFTKSNNHTIWF